MTTTTRNLLYICALYAVSLVAPPISQADDGTKQPSLQQTSPQQTSSQQALKSLNPTQLASEENCDEPAEIDMKCISDIKAFVIGYDNHLEVIGYDSQTGNFIRGTKKYGARDGKITPYELIMPMVDVALMDDEAYKSLPIIDDPASARNQMRNSKYYPMKIDLFIPLDINGDGVINIDDDINGDGVISSEDRESYEKLMQKIWKDDKKPKPQREYLYGCLVC